MECKPPLALEGLHTRERAQIGQRNLDALTLESGTELRYRAAAVRREEPVTRTIEHGHPVRDEFGGCLLGRIVLDTRAHPSATRVADNDDMLDPQIQHRELECRADTMIFAVRLVR